MPKTFRERYLFRSPTSLVAKRVLHRASRGLPKPRYHMTVDVERDRHARVSEHLTHDFRVRAFVRRRVVQVCLRSWNLVFGSPVRLSRGFQYLSCRVSRLKVTSHRRLLASLALLEHYLHYRLAVRLNHRPEGQARRCPSLRGPT
jgi:hypothetical protein